MKFKAGRRSVGNAQQRVGWVWSSACCEKQIKRYELENERRKAPKVMEVDGSDDFPDFNWVLFREKAVHLSGVYMRYKGRTTPPKASSLPLKNCGWKTILF